MAKKQIPALLKPKNRDGDSLARTKPTREPYDYVLIVCEGSKTEPNYLRGLQRDLRLSNANIHVLDRRHGSDPMSVVNAALKEYDADPEYDRIFCVFDRDTHTTYDAAVQKISQHKLFQDKKLFGITSEPCFEIWLLLHFKYSAAPFRAAGKKSSCDRLLDEIQKQPDLGKYEKGYPDIFAVVGSRTKTAIRNAQALSKENARTASTNPSTKMHLLATYLTAVAEKKIGASK